jgi:polar amino acid transport system substrate-binding protein
VQDPYAKVVSPVALSDEPYGIGVRKDKVDLVRFINAVLEQVRKGRWAEIYAETMGRAIPTVPKIPPARYGR